MPGFRLDRHIISARASGPARGRLGRLLLAAALALSAAGSAQALEFIRKPLENGMVLLLVVDKSPCAENESCGFKEGDANNLDRLLRSERFTQVLLYSGGGDSKEGERVGAVLRARGAWVRVVRGHYCVSACTAAFLGGVIREVDEGAPFRVHSSSSYLNGVPAPVWKRVEKDPALALGELIDNTIVFRVEWTLSRFAYVQRMISGEPRAAMLDAGRQACTAQARQQLASPASMRQIIQRVGAEGRPALNDIMENTERRTAEICLAHLASQSAELGPRANHVLRIMDIMTASRIGATINLSPQALREAGFVTQ